MKATESINPRSRYADRLRDFPGLLFAEHGVFQNRGQWREYFRRRIGAGFDGRVIFEIGCFDAVFLGRMATKHPHIGFVGLDWKCKPLVDGARAVFDCEIRNIALLRGRGQDIARIFADGELDQIWLFHPDPCDRPAELKNRLFAEPFLLDVHRVLRAGASLCLKTDHAGYHQSVLALLGGPPQAGTQLGNCFELIANTADFWHDPIARAATATHVFAGESTLFERRFIRKRLPIRYIELRKRHALE